MKSPVGVVKPQSFDFASLESGLKLESGKTLGPIHVQYETYGRPSEARDNAILIHHAFSGDAHAAGVHHPDDTRVGWWEDMIGPGKSFDTEKYWVVCSNVLGGCGGTTGPGSIDPRTGREYGAEFPVVTIGDMVEVQKRLMEHLQIPRWYAVVGGSMGGMQSLEWAVRFPHLVDRTIVIAAAASLTPQGIAFNAVGRNAILSDPRWNEGRYYGHEEPIRGLAIARMVGHITYLSSEAMHLKFGRRLQDRSGFEFDFDDQFAVESYLEYQGDKFLDRFDANSYLYLTKAMDYFDLAVSYGSLAEAMRKVDSRFLVISYSSDWLFPTWQSKEIVYALAQAGKEVSFVELDSPYGHDAFLLEFERQRGLVTSFLST